MSTSRQPIAPLRRPPRPFSVTLLAVLVLTIAGLNLLRVSQAILLRDFLAEFPTVSLPYLIVSGLVWSISGLACGWGLWRPQRWASRFTIIFFIAYSLVYWLERIVLSKYNPWTNAPFFIGANLLLLASVWWILSRPKARAFFGEVYER